MVEFNVETMKNFANKDMLIKRMIMDLSKRNPKTPYNEILEIVFNSEVIDDSTMEDAYLSCR